uniref:Transposase n=1 Tax=Strongyloides venezuelensis TaxID=75913 RepID=A0A0K0FS61_STRVS
MLRKRIFFHYKKTNYASKEDLMEAIMNDYSSIPFCCLYMLEAIYNKYTKSYIKHPFSQLERVVKTKDVIKKPTFCNIKKYCSLMSKIKIYTKNGKTVYEYGGEIFYSLYYVRLHLIKKQDRRVKFDNEKRLYFNEEQSPTAVRDAKKNHQWFSRSISKA